MTAADGDAGPREPGGPAGARPLAIEARGLVKVLGGIRAVDGVDLRVPLGAVHGLLGPDGAGKTTTIRVLATLLRPDGGSVRVLGHDVVTEADAVRRRISVSGQSVPLDDGLTGAENLLLLARLLGFSRAAARQRTDQLLAAFGLAGVAGRRVRTYPEALRRCLDLAAGIVVRPDLVLLDEPTTELDPHSRDRVEAVIRALGRCGTTVLLGTRHRGQADRIADRVSVLDAGRVVAEGTPAQLRASAPDGCHSLRSAARPRP